MLVIGSSSLPMINPMPYEYWGSWMVMFLMKTMMIIIKMFLKITMKIVVKNLNVIL